MSYYSAGRLNTTLKGKDGYDSIVDPGEKKWVGDSPYDPPYHSYSPPRLTDYKEIAPMELFSYIHELQNRVTYLQRLSDYNASIFIELLATLAGYTPMKGRVEEMYEGFKKLKDLSK